MTQNLKVGIVQMKVEKGWPIENTKKIISMISSSREDIDIVVSPELSLTGYVENYEKLKEEVMEAQKLLENFARERKISLLYGSPLYDKKGVYNAACFFSNSKTNCYRKIHLFPPFKEKDRFIQGNSPGLFNYKGTKIGVIICYDLRFPELYRTIAIKGARVIFCLSLWPKVRYEHLRTLLKARSIENQLITVSCNATGGSFAGRSAVFYPSGDVIFLADQREQLFSVDINLEVVDEERAKFPVFSEIRKNLFYREVEFEEN